MSTRLQYDLDALLALNEATAEVPNRGRVMQTYVIRSEESTRHLHHLHPGQILTQAFLGPVSEGEEASMQDRVLAGI